MLSCEICKVFSVVDSFFETKDDSDGVELSQDLLESVFYSFRLTRDAQKKAAEAGGAWSP